MTEKLGATGKFTDGSLGPGDQGELCFRVRHDPAGNVVLDFGKDLSWFAMRQETAIALAQVLLRHAGAKDVDKIGG